MLIAYLIWRFSSNSAALRHVFENDLPLLRPLAGAYGYDLNASPLVVTIRKVFDIRPDTLVWVSVAVLGYAVLQLIEGVGLWLGKRWAESLTVVATSAFLPLEIYELNERVTPVRVIALIVNVAIVVYLIIAKRLFGVRGGAAAAERERRGESLLEVKRAAA